MIATFVVLENELVEKSCKLCCRSAFSRPFPSCLESALILFRWPLPIFKCCMLSGTIYPPIHHQLLHDINIFNTWRCWASKRKGVPTWRRQQWKSVCQALSCTSLQGRHSGCRLAWRIPLRILRRELVAKIGAGWEPPSGRCCPSPPRSRPPQTSPRRSSRRPPGPAGRLGRRSSSPRSGRSPPPSLPPGSKWKQT